MLRIEIKLKNSTVSQLLKAIAANLLLFAPGKEVSSGAVMLISIQINMSAYSPGIYISKVFLLNNPQTQVIRIILKNY